MSGPYNKDRKIKPLDITFSN